MNSLQLFGASVFDKIFGGMPTDLGGIIATIVSAIFVIIGVVAVFVIIYAGFLLMTSAGDPGKVKKGKDTILWGVIGLIVSILAYAIIQAVLGVIK